MDSFRNNVVHERCPREDSRKENFYENVAAYNRDWNKLEQSRYYRLTMKGGNKLVKELVNWFRGFLFAFTPYSNVYYLLIFGK